MDNKRLKTVLENISVPEVDENAKKRALNLALAEFESAQQEKQKNLQGVSIFARLIGKSQKTDRREKMMFSKKMAFGGTATAMAVVLVCGITIFGNQNYSPMDAARLNTVDFNVGASSTAGSVAGSVAPAPLAQAPGRRSQFAQNKPLERARVLNESEAVLSKGKIADRRIASADKEERAEIKVSKKSLSAHDAPASVVASPPAIPSVMQEGVIAGEADAFSSAQVVMLDEIAPNHTYEEVGRDQFEDFEENQIKLVSEEPVSTFSVDVDTASYSFMRSQINAGVLPQKDSIRIEELINYFDYDYAQPETKEVPFKHSVAVTPSPWKEGNKLVHIGIKGFDVEQSPRSNLVFLLDVSGSMNAPDKLPLLINSMKMLLDSLNPDDTVGIVVYAGAAGTVLEPTKVSEKNKIVAALENLRAGGSTAGAEGIRQAYNLAESVFEEDAVNRVILATDGDFNVGITNREELKGFVERKRETGIFLSVFGFGQGNYNDHLMQELAQNGNGVAAYIDNLNEARKVLVDEATSTLFPIAKDVKIQIEFNPSSVAEYRLVGYETRHLEREDFNNDAVDAGDIGAGHTVTAIYEITPVDGPRSIDESRYTKTQDHEADADFTNEYAFLKMRYKLPAEDKSKLITTPITVDNEELSEAMMQETGWASAVASFGQLLKGGKYTGKMTYDHVIKLANDTKGEDEFGYRAEFINLVRLAKTAAALQDTQP